MSDSSNRWRPGTCFSFMHLGLTVAKPSDVGIKAILNELLLDELDGLEVAVSCDVEELAAEVDGVDWVSTVISASLDKLSSKGTSSRAKKKEKKKESKYKNR